MAALRSRALALLVLAWSASTVAAVRAQTDDAQALLEQGRRLYADLEYQEAESALTRALATPSTSSWVICSAGAGRANR